MSSFEEKFVEAGNTYYFDISLYALSGKDGVQIGFCVLLRDITDRRQAEEKYRRLFYDNPMVMYIVRLKDLRILEVNEAAIKQYGYRREEFLQRNAFDWRLEEDREKLREYLWCIQRGGADGPAGVWRHVLKDGKHIFMQICLHRIRYNNEDAVMAIAQNITDRLDLERQLEEQRHSQQQQLTEAIMEAQETERAGIARELHDNVNQMLGVSRLFLDVAIRSSASKRNELVRKSSGYILEAIEAIRRLSKSLVSPLDRLLTLETAISCLAEELMSVHQFSIKLNKENFDATSFDDKFKVNIFRIVQEQLNNIVKHANCQNISIGLTATDSTIKIAIADDGQGFDTVLQRQGIGLSNIRSRAELYKGTMDLVSSPGQGCCLVIEFPRSASNS